MALDKKIAFLGGGNMAEALIKGMLTAHVAQAGQLTVTDVSSSRLTLLKNKYRVSVSVRNTDAVRDADVVVLCVKPQVIGGVLAEIAPVADAGKLVLSIAAGVPLERIERSLTGGPRVIRVMPNTPALVLAGATGLAAGRGVRAGDLELAQELFGAVGKVVVVNERLLDAVTGLSGSGPAYVFTLIEALVDGGVKAGLTRAVATDLAVQTVFGAARMVMETREHPAKLRDMVTSPGGTTIAGLHELEKGKFRAVIMSAVEAATRRSRELGGRAAGPAPKGMRGKKAGKASRKAAPAARKKKAPRKSGKSAKRR